MFGLDKTFSPLWVLGSVSVYDKDLSSAFEIGPPLRWSARVLQRPPPVPASCLGLRAAMGFVQRLAKKIPSSPNLPSLDDSKGEKVRLPRLSFLRRRIRLKGNSSISIPLGFVLLFPLLVILLIILLLVRHPSSPARILMPAGAPPTIRYASTFYTYITMVR